MSSITLLGLGGGGGGAAFLRGRLVTRASSYKSSRVEVELLELELELRLIFDDPRAGSGISW